MTCWKGYERVPGTVEYSKGSCRKKRSSTKKVTSLKKRKSQKVSGKHNIKKQSTRKKRSSQKRKRSTKKNKKVRSAKKCTPGKNKKYATLVQGKCVRYGDPNMTIKKNIPARKKSFCARHKCSEARDPTTPKYQSCKKWNCGK